MKVFFTALTLSFILSSVVITHHVSAQTPLSTNTAQIIPQKLEQQGVIDDFLDALFGFFLKKKFGGGDSGGGSSPTPGGSGGTTPPEGGVQTPTPSQGGELSCSEPGQQSIYAQLRQSSGIGSDVKARDRICRTCNSSVVHKGNLSCLNSLHPEFSKGKGQLDSSVNSYYYLQCVGWAQYIAQLNYGYTLGPGDAVNIRPASGYKIIENPSNAGSVRTGDFIIFKRSSDSPAGHIAYISGVLDSDKFIISEANYGVYGKVKLRYLSLAAQRGRIARLLRR